MLPKNPQILVLLFIALLVVLLILLVTVGKKLWLRSRGITIDATVETSGTRGEAKWRDPWTKKDRTFSLHYNYDVRYSRGERVRIRVDPKHPWIYAHEDKPHGNRRNRGR